jgi:RNA polymerase sigma factor (sigma-70 family)
MTDDEQLLQQYRRERSESAFGQLVAKYIDLVYAAALRVVGGDAHLAQDVAQTVFIDLARKTWSLPSDVVLAGWLHRHTCYTASTAVRTERRRRSREQKAMEMRALDDNTEPPWEQIAPCLDEALEQLNSSNRDVLVLRFLRGLDFRAVGAALGIGEDAAQKRASRALEKLRDVLSRRGVELTTAALASVLVTEAVTAAPAGLAVTVTLGSLTAATGIGRALGVLKPMAATQLRAGMMGAIVVASVVVPLAIQHEAQAKLRDQNEALSRQATQLVQFQEENERLSNLLTHTENSQPLPVNQLSQVLRLRGEIGRLHAFVQELTRAKTNEQMSRDDFLASVRQFYSERVARLKQVFEANPAESVPELQYLADRDWLELVMYDSKFDATNGYRLTMSSARSRAQVNFAFSALQNALLEYSKNNDDQFPNDPSQLKPYFKLPIDDSALQNWVVLFNTNLPSEIRLNEDRVITQKAPINPEFDQRVVIGLRNGRLGRGGTRDWSSAQ